jgi:hypothetical protein
MPPYSSLQFSEFRSAEKPVDIEQFIEPANKFIKFPLSFRLVRNLSSRRIPDALRLRE